MTHKKKMFVLVGLVLVAVLALAACTTADTEEKNEMETSEEMEMEETDEMAETETDMNDSGEDTMAEDPSMEEVDVEALIIERVDGKHDVERIFGAVKTREEWSETLDRMIGYGAKITPEEKEMMIVWLLENQGEAMQDEAAAEVDVEALIVERLDGKHDLDRILNADKTREEWVETIDRMIGYGAKITDAEKEMMIDWLLNR